MLCKFEEGKDLIIEAVTDRLFQKMPAGQAELCAEFVRQFYSTVALEDLQEWDVEDLYGAAMNFWSLIQTRELNETKIRIYNPDFERHGWQTTHTVIEVLTKDMPFIVDSLRLVLNRMGLTCYLAIHMGGIALKRDAHHQVTKVLPRGTPQEKDVLVEAPIFLEIDRQTDVLMLQELHQNFEEALADTRAVVDDWPTMREKVREAIVDLDKAAQFLDPEELNETKSFLTWIEDHHFTFLAVRDYELIQKGKETFLQPLLDTGLGTLRPSRHSVSNALKISSMTPEARELILSPRILVMSKTDTEATVHRHAYTDYIGIKRYNQKGEVIGERRILGLYTSVAYNTSPKAIPFLRHKVAQVIQNSKLNPRSHAGKVLLNILETLPRDDLIQASEQALLDIAMGIYYMQDRPRIRMFARTDVYHRFISCLVYVPKERFNTELRREMQRILAESFDAIEVTFSTWFPESVLARIHFIIRIDPKQELAWDFKEIEQKLVEIGRSWNDDLKTFLLESFGEEHANRLFIRYKNAFPSGYCDVFSARTAVYDIKHIEDLSEDNPLGMNFYRPMDELPDSFRLKVYQHNNTIPLSDVLPIIECLGMRAISERPYVLCFEDGQTTWISDFSLQCTREISFDIDEIKDLFQNVFASVWFGEAENDGFNQLVLAAGLNWRQVSILRSYAKYFKQIRFTFSQDYIESALSNNPVIARKIVELFEYRFNPIEMNDRAARTDACVNQIIEALDDVSNLDEDKIIRQYVQVILQTLRTNYYQIDVGGSAKEYISFKLNSREIPGVPKPYPMFEIFVYSPRFEGVHLRCGKVARGGLRWSDRKEDFRTEVLGLMKAQQVKNAVIVPSGAKGGFVPKCLPINGTREEVMQEGIACYQLFIRGLLDITDNYQLGAVIKPPSVYCYDEDDPYLVVAADKGTATFSDIANAISIEYGFWLGDAFASGGSVGYDHKKMGITARGAWESVKRHFHELSMDIDKHSFTVVGIGDMSGDVFGNGMLLSRQIKLLAAFNHLHIFIDPNPRVDISFQERERLFHLPLSSWIDYDKDLISKGGGVFNRNAKSIPVSKEMRQVFGIKQAQIEPNELIRVVLTAQIDLLWSAGIGTFVKAQTESHEEVGDRANDSMRINGNELRCKVVGEGGNLGLTQLGRIEYELNNGLIFTDFIDNSAGVHCSDREVNIKILLNTIVAGGDLTFKQRNELLSEMTDEVAALVLRSNYVQPRAISYSVAQTVRSAELYSRYMNELERTGKLDRELEFLPDEKTLMERKLMGKGLTRPEVAVLLCYSKTILKDQILASDVPEDLYLKTFLVHYFPKPLQEQFSERMSDHPLKREILATTVSNIVVNEMGPTFVYRMQDETGAPISAIVRAYLISRTILNVVLLWKNLAELESHLTVEQQTDMILLYVRLLRRVTRWFLRNERMRLNISRAVKRYSPGISAIKKAMPDTFIEGHRRQYEKHYAEYIEMGINSEFAHELTITRALFSVMDIIEVAQKMDIEVIQVAELYFMIGEYLELTWIRSQVIAHTAENNWESLSREALRDDLDWQQRQLTAGIISSAANKKDFIKVFKSWTDSHQHLITRWRQILTDLRASTNLNYTMFFVAIRELLDLTQTTIQMTEKDKDSK